MKSHSSDNGFVLVTGATGYIGWQLCQALAAEGIQVKALYRTTPVTLRSGVHWVKGDITSKDSLTDAMEDVTQVYHCAGFARLFTRNKNQFYDLNVRGTINVLEAAAYQGVQRVVCTSSAGVFGPSSTEPMTEEDIRLEPINNDYDMSKFLMEEEVKQYIRNGYDAVIVNPPRVYGPGLMNHANIITRLVQQFLKRSYYIIPGDGEARGCYAFIEDVVRGHILAMKYGRMGERYALGGWNLSYNEFFELLQQVSGLRRMPLKISIQGLAVIASIRQFWDWIVGSEVSITPEIVKRVSKHRMVSCQKAINELGYTITPMADGLIKTFQFLGHMPTFQPSGGESSLLSAS